MSRLFCACVSKDKRAFSSASVVIISMNLATKWMSRWPKIKPKKPTKGPWYQLTMFPYPSGNLHIGHLRVYTISDVLARFRRLQGYDVLHPIGWDAFGLPAENAAIERNISANKWTRANIQQMRSQLQQMLASFDWDKEVVTCDPEYYKHTQRLFLEFYEAGLAYRSAASVNWDPVEKTVLANEQVDASGRSWRSGSLVEKKVLEQWFLKITEYGKEMSDNLAILKDWPESVKAQQRNWIGISKGVNVQFSETITVYTTRPETLTGVQFIALALTHPIVEAQAKHNEQLATFCVTQHEPGSKSGYRLDIEVTNPLTKKRIPVYATPYVVSDYGSGAVMGVPGHDERDNAFWRSLGKKPVYVIQTEKDVKDAYGFNPEKGLMSPESGFEGLSSDQCAEEVIKILGAKWTQRMRLRDWLISRQRFWGAPIPMIHCGSCGIVPVPRKDLPVLLPHDHSTPLSTCEEFMNTQCPECGGKARRDPDTMDTFMDSSWYFMRYTDPHNKDVPFDPEKASRLLPVNMYLGGVEHAILHLLYSRFFSLFLRDRGFWQSSYLNGEPFARLVTQGMVHGKTHVDPQTGRFLKPDEVEEGVIKATGLKAKIVYEKMSKSKYNGVDPSKVIADHGPDATRAHVLFQAPITDILDWDESKIVGVERWLRKVLALVAPVVETPMHKILTHEELNAWNTACFLIENITTSFATTLALNTVVSDLMKLTRCVDTLAGTEFGETALKTLLVALAPVCPAHAEEAWEKLAEMKGAKWKSIFLENWPEINPLPETQTGKFVIMVNGRKLTLIDAPLDIKEENLLSLVRATYPTRLENIKRVIFKQDKRIMSILVD